MKSIVKMSHYHYLPELKTKSRPSTSLLYKQESHRGRTRILTWCYSRPNSANRYLSDV